MKMIVDVLVEHFFMNLSKKCSCSDPRVKNVYDWAAHVRDMLAVDAEIDSLEQSNIPVRRAVELLNDASLASQIATESNNPNSFSFAAGFMTGVIQRVIGMLEGTNL